MLAAPKEASHFVESVLVQLMIQIIRIPDQSDVLQTASNHVLLRDKSPLDQEDMTCKDKEIVLIKFRRITRVTITIQNNI